MSKFIVPPKLRPLYTGKRQVIVYGGRSSGKSVAAAGATLVTAMNSDISGNILCVREKQMSLNDSVLGLLKSHIEQYPTTFLGFDSGANYLRNRNTNVNFIFKGLSDMTADNIKSIPNIILTWIEEASKISKQSLRTLLPTIFRTKQSRLIITMNRDTDHDPVWVELCRPALLGFLKNTDVIKINSEEIEPFLTKATIERREYDRLHTSDFEHVWHGEPLSSSEGSVYGKQTNKLIDDGRYLDFEPDPDLKVFTTWDLGWGDSMAVIFWQKRGNEIDAIDVYECFSQSVVEASPEVEKIIKENGYKIMYHVLPFDAESHNTATSATPSGSARHLLKDRVIVGAKQSREAGVTALRNSLTKGLRIRKGKCERLIECLSKQLFEWNSKAKIFTKTPSHEGGYSNINDAARYGALEFARIRPQHHPPTTEEEKKERTDAMMKSIFDPDGAWQL